MPQECFQPEPRAAAREGLGAFQELRRVGSTPLSPATSHPAEHPLRATFSQGQQNGSRMLYQRHQAVVAGLMTGLRWFRETPAHCERDGDRPPHRLWSGWMQAQAQAMQTIHSRVRARGTPGAPEAAQAPAEPLGSNPVPAALSHLCCPSSAPGKGKPGISCSQHIPGIYLVGLLL